MRRVTLYVTLVWLGALTLGATLFLARPRAAEGELGAVLVLAGLAVVAEMMAVLLPRSAQGSVAFIPYIAAVLVAPNWGTVAACAAVKLLTELLSRRQFVKLSFNVAQIAASLAAAALVYEAAGGLGMLGAAPQSLATATRTSGFAAFAAFVTTFVLNSALVFGAVAISSGISFRQVARDNAVGGVGVDLLASPIVFVFAWVFAAYGPIAAFAFWVPIVGFRQLSKTNLELAQTNQELLQLMVKSIEARDPYTSGHSRRVQSYAIQIARAAGMPQRQVDEVGRAALLHDVGKIYEKYAPILAKADKLTPEEWVTMQQHPQDGAELVATMTRLRDLVPAIRHHHERWDGTGYPSGLSGEAIPRSARIIALADTIDAMTSERAYRVAMNADDVRGEIEKHRGKQFDPELVDCIIASGVLERIFVPQRAERGFGELALLNTDRRAG